MIDTQSVSGATQLVRVCRTRHAALRRGRADRAGTEGVAAVALAGVLDPEVVEAVAEARAGLERHGVRGVADAAERAAGSGLGLAPEPRPAGADGARLRRPGARGCVVDVQLQPVTGTAVFQAAARACHRAVRERSGGG